MEVVRLTDPQALFVPQLAQLLKRAVESGTLLAPGGFDSVTKDIFDFTTDPNQFMLLGAEKGDFKAVVLGFFPNGSLFPYPTVVLIYNEGTKDLSVAMRNKLLDTLVSRGYTRMLAVNASGYTDKAWMKTLTPTGATSKIIGSLGMFEVK